MFRRGSCPEQIDLTEAPDNLWKNHLFEAGLTARKQPFAFLQIQAVLLPADQADGLLPDKYKITETKTQSGKTLLKEPIDVTIPMTVTQSEVNDQNIDVSNAIKQGNNYYFYHLTYEVSNDSTLNLPSTGGFSNIKTYLPLIGGFVLILAAGFYYLKKKKGMKILKKKK